ncbi:MAG: ATP-binding protein [Bacillota bacterium]
MSLRTGVTACGAPRDIDPLYTRMLHLITLACCADHVLVVETGFPLFPGDRGSTHIYPEPALAEEARLWQYVAGYVSESARRGTLAEIPRDLRNALGIGSVLVTPIFDGDAVVAAIAAFSDSASPPLDSDDKWVLDELAGEFLSMVRKTAPDVSRAKELSHLAKVLRARGVVRSIYELCSTFGTATALAVKMSLAEAAVIRILNQDTGELELVTLSGGGQAVGAQITVSAARCSAVGTLASSFHTGGVGVSPCPLLRSRRGAKTFCVPLIAGRGAAGVLELWRPSSSRLDATGMRLVRAIASVVEQALAEARMYSAEGGIPAKTAFIRGISVAARTSSDPNYVMRQLLIGLRRAVAFDIGAFTDSGDGLEGPSILLASSPSPGVPHAGVSQPMSENSRDTRVTFVKGGPEAEGWVTQALNQASPFGDGLRVRPFYLPGTRWPAGLLVPLASDGHAVGVLVLGKASGERFSLDEIGFVDDVRHDLAALWEHFKHRVLPERHPAEEAMAERIAALEQLAASTAHEIKNPLSVIKGYLQVIHSDSATSEETKKRIGRLFHQLDQINNVVEDLAQLARPVPSDLSLLSLTGILEEVLEIIEPQASSMNIKIVRSYSEDTPEVTADGGKLQQVFLNLCRNSIEAMTPGGGELRISTRVSPDRRTVEVEFRDTGPGMSAEVMSQVFRPFFTTKRHGAGLGLSISLHIVKQHGGTIRAESAPGAGAAFTVVLPVAYGST